VEDEADSMRRPRIENVSFSNMFRCHRESEVKVKARLLACAVAGLACAFPVAAGAQGAQPFSSGPPVYGGGPRNAVPLDQITANVRAAGLEPLSRPVLRGTVYYMRAVNRARAEMRVAIDARSGRVLSATRVGSEPPALPVDGEPAPAPAPRYEPHTSSRGYSEAAPSPPADVPSGGQSPPPGRVPNYGVTSPAKRLAAQPPRPRSSRPGESGDVTGTVPAAPAAKPESPPSPPGAPSPVPAKPVMVPIAPLE
jgi:hypothetical protein